MFSMFHHDLDLWVTSCAWHIGYSSRGDCSYRATNFCFHTIFYSTTTAWLHKNKVNASRLTMCSVCMYQKKARPFGTFSSAGMFLTQHSFVFYIHNNSTHYSTITSWGITDTSYWQKWVSKKLWWSQEHISQILSIATTGRLHQA